MKHVLRGLVLGGALAVPAALVGLGVWQGAAGDTRRLAPRVAFTRADGTPAALHARGPTTFVEFFATWCEACRSALPRLQAYAGKHRDVRFLAVDVGEPVPAAAAVAKLWGVRGVVFDPQARAAREYGVQSLPTTYAIDAAGRIRAVHPGFEDDFEAGLERIRVRLQAAQSR